MSERQKFEDSWKSAFDGAEAAPPDRVWSSIELDLAAQESATMKKRVIFWQRMAAGFLLFSLATGIYAFYPKNAEVKIEETAKVEDSKIEDLKIEDDKIEDLRLADAKTSSVKTTTTTKEIARSNYSLPKNLLFPNLNTKVETKSALPETINSSEPVVAAVEVEEKKEETVAVVSPSIKEEEENPEEIVKPKRRATESNLWVALGASAGNYSPNTPSASSAPAVSDFNTAFNAAPQLAQAQTPQKSEPKVGTSYSFGLAVGKKFGRIVLQTGVNLGKQQIEYSSNYTAQTASNNAKAISSDYIGTEADSYKTSATNTYTLNSTMEIVSIPVQAGYMIIDRRLGWQFNAGVSPDFFIKNVMTDESGKREKFTQSAGNESPYRSVNWSGLLNTELSYRIGTHYRLSLVPGVRYSFNSILKEPTNSGRPVIIDVGFRFRYLFD